MYDTNKDAPDRRLQFVVTTPVVLLSAADSGLYDPLTADCTIRSSLRCR